MAVSKSSRKGKGRTAKGSSTKSSGRTKIAKESVAKVQKTKPPNVAVRAGGQGERIVTVKWPDGAVLELSCGTEEGWHVVKDYPGRSFVLDRVEVIPEVP